MHGKRQTTQYSLALEPMDRGETLISGCLGAEPSAAKPAARLQRNISWRRCAIERISEVRGNAFEGTKVVRAWMG
jgi:hypothetical protein